MKWTLDYLKIDLNRGTTHTHTQTNNKICLKGANLLWYFAFYVVIEFQYDFFSFFLLSYLYREWSCNRVESLTIVAWVTWFKTIYKFISIIYLFHIITQTHTINVLNIVSLFPYLNWFTKISWQIKNKNKNISLDQGECSEKLMRKMDSAEWKFLSLSYSIHTFQI